MRLLHRAITASCGALLASTVLAQQPPLFRTFDAAVSGAAHGVSITGVGDLNGNGWNDVVVGEPGDLGAAPNFPIDGGSFWIYDGAPVGAGTCACGPNVGGCVPSGASVQAINAVYGMGLRDNLGAQVLGVGDVDGDTIGDLLVTRAEGDLFPPVWVRNGSVLLYSGAALAAGAQTPMATITIPQHPVSSTLQSQWFGSSLQSIGDWTGDGVEEVCIGAPHGHDFANASLDVGMFEVHDLVAAAAGAPSLLLRVYGNWQNGMFGTAAVGLDDLTGDGIPEFAVGAPFIPTSGSNGMGVVSVYEGGSGVELMKISVPTSSGNLLGSSFTAFDQNGDGVRDLAIGEPGYGFGFARVRIFDASLFTVGVASQLTEWRPGATVVQAVSGSSYFDTFGTSQANMGDLNGDGIDDILVGSAYGSNFDADNPNGWFPSAPQFIGSGAAYLMSGATGAVLKIYSEACADNSGQDSNDANGYAVANVGDLDLDGVDDLGIGAPGTDYNGVAGTGVARFYSGAYRIGVPYGVANPNSTGLPATISATGSASLADNSLQLICDNVPGGGSGQFLISATSSTGTPYYQGILYLGMPFYRLPVAQPVPGTGPVTVTYDVDLGGMPAVQLAIMGTKVSFQYWFLDPAGGRNLSNAVEIGILP